MSVTGEVFAKKRPFGAYENPAFPTGLWVARGEVTGDATGGANTLDVFFAGSVQPRTQEAFSIEQLSVTYSSGTSDETLQLVTVNLDPDLSGKDLANAAQFWAVQMLDVSVAGIHIDAVAAAALQGVFLGRQDAANSACGLSFIKANVNLQVMAVRVQGYVWGPRAVSIPSGPQRPIPGLYKA